jgi:hypothetical protein
VSQESECNLSQSKVVRSGEAEGIETSAGAVSARREPANTSFYELLHRNMRGLQPATKAHNFALQQRRSLIVMLLSWTFPP